MRNTATLLLTSALTLGLPLVAHAQDQAPEHTPEHARGAYVENGDIIVTARKREESVLNVPVIASVLSAEKIDSRQLVDLREVQRMVPALSLGENNGALGTQISLRGVGTTAINANIDASVSLNIDGLQITQATSYASAMFDLARIEVLKGPQSLFYGKNSPGGVISLRSADPTDKAELIARMGYEGEARQLRSELIVSGPLSDTLKVRVAGMYDMQDGFFRNTTTAVAPNTGAHVPYSQRAAENHNWIVRGTVLWQPSDTFSARLKANVTHDVTEGGDPRQLASCPEGIGAIAGTNIAFINPNENCKLDRGVGLIAFDAAAFPAAKNGGVPFKQLDHQFGSLELNYDLSPVLQLNSTTGYYHMKFQSELSGTSSSFAGPAFISSAQPLDRRDITQELRLESSFDGPINFLLGGFYQDGRINNTIDLPSNIILRPTGGVRLTRYQHLIDITSYSGYGQVRWNVVPQLELAAGARWTHEDRSMVANLFNGTTNAFVNFPITNPKIQSENVAPEFTATFKPTEDLTLFGSYKVAYKSGSFDTTSLSGIRPDYSFGDEKAEGGEAGIKARLLDRSLNVSLAGYYYRYKGLQVGAVQPTLGGGTPVNRTLNAGAARVYGAELDLNYAPRSIEGLAFQLGAAFTQARFLELNDAPCYGGQTFAMGCNQLFTPSANQAAPGVGAIAVGGVSGFYRAQDLSGVSLVRAPKWQVNFGFTYDLPLQNGWTLSFSNSNQYSASYLTTLGRRADFVAPSYFKTDFGLAVKGADERWELAFIGKNLNNKITASTCTSSNIANGTNFGGQITGGSVGGPAGVDELGCYADRGRELWLRLTLRPLN